MKILAIETSCDETAIAFLEASGNLETGPRFKILENLIASQIKIHRPFGGVVPNLAKREHLKNLPILFKKLTINRSLSDIDLVAATVGPGLEPCLWAGINFARNLYRQLKTKNLRPKTKLLGVNHLEGHLYSFLLPQKGSRHQAVSIKKLIPAIALIVSGGHTILLLIKNLKNIRKLGETRDDAAGEAFDKVARLLNLPYPGGPELEKLARLGNAGAADFPRPMLDQKNYDFSFSGLKTAVLYYLRDNKTMRREDVAASFQSAAIDVLIKKTMRAAGEFGAKSIIVSGGVAANKELCRRFRQEVKKFKNLKVFIPDVRFCTDNAVIIGAAGYIGCLRKKQNRLVARGNLNF